MRKKLAGPIANSPRDEQDSFVGEPASRLPVGDVPRWPPNPRKVTKDTFHAKVSGEPSRARADRAPSFRRGGFVAARRADGGDVSNTWENNIARGEKKIPLPRPDPRNPTLERSVYGTKPVKVLKE